MAISEEMKVKSVKQFKLQLNGVMEPFNSYGLGIYIIPAIEQITEMSLLLHKRLNGEDIPLTLEAANGRLRKRYKK